MLDRSNQFPVGFCGELRVIKGCMAWPLYSYLARMWRVGSMCWRNISRTKQKNALRWDATPKQGRHAMFGKQMTFRLEKELYEKLEDAAKKQMRSVGGLIRLLLTRAVNEKKHLN